MMDWKVLGTIAVVFVLLPSSQCTPKDDQSLINVTSHGIEHRYYRLLEELRNVLDGHTSTAKTSNAGLANQPSSSIQATPARSCSDILAAGQNKSGVYTIHPTGLPPLKVYCEMETRGGGWTVIQRRQDGSVDFYRDWLECAAGFGDVYGEYWLGLHNMHILTHNTPMKLYIFLEDFEGNTRYAVYDFFAVGSEHNKFNLDIGSYFGTAGDGLNYHRGEKFATKDQDNNNCGKTTKGAWWYKGCYHSNLNGRYLQGAVDEYALAWSPWKGSKYSMKTSIMMIRPVYQN